MTKVPEYRIEVKLTSYRSNNNLHMEVVLADPKEPGRGVDRPYSSTTLPIPESIVNRIRADVLKEVIQ